MILKILLWILALILLLVSSTFVVDYIISAPGYQGPKSNHFNGSTFKNISNVRARGLNDVVRWSVTGNPGEWQQLSEQDVETRQPDPPEEGEIAITFINHATFLIQVNGFKILTDPIWSDRASPFNWIGPNRMRPPGVKFDDLPGIDAVLISHNHYDHLDLPTVRRLKETFDPQFIVPLGVGAFLKQNGISKIVELDWWQQFILGEDLNISSVPAQHFSGRGLTDRDKTLWSGYVIENDAGNVYFAGDTGYDGFFPEIDERFGPIETALIPIGAYRPRWFMEPIHVDPEQAVQIHLDVQARQSIGIHFGTFPLADDGMTEPLEDLQSAKEKFNIPSGEFTTLKEGQTQIIVPSSTAIPIEQLSRTAAE